MKTKNTVSIDLRPANMLNEDKKFLLSSAEWLAIQTFVNAATNLPTTLTLFGAKLPSKPTGGLEGYQDLVDAYKKLNTSCTKFNTEILPSSFKCASNLIAYNLKAYRYYRAIWTEYLKLVSDPTTPEQQKANEKVRANIKGICDSLTKDAKEYAEHADKVYTQLTEFSTSSAASQTEVTDLNKIYTAKLTGKEGSITRLKNDLEDLKKALQALQDEYDHDVIVAATTPTYAFMWPFGTIAAGIVAGIYGDKAVKAKEQMEEFRKRISSTEGTLKADTIISLDLTQITTDLGSIGDKIKAALPHIGKIRGMWNGLSDALQNIIKLIKDDIEDQELDVLLDNAIQSAIDGWKAISDSAEEYRMNAYVQIKDEKDMPKLIAAAHALKKRLEEMEVAA